MPAPKTGRQILLPQQFRSPAAAAILRIRETFDAQRSSAQISDPKSAAPARVRRMVGRLLISSAKMMSGVQYKKATRSMLTPAP